MIGVLDNFNKDASSPNIRYDEDEGISSLVEALILLDNLIGKSKNNLGTNTLKATNIIEALLEHDNEIGEIEDLNKDSNEINKNNLVSSINKLNELIGLLNDLSTEKKNNIVAAINEHEE